MTSGDTKDEEAPLIVDNLLIRKTKNHTKDIHILSSSFLLVFTAYGAAQNLETTVNTEQDLGTISLGILYLSFTFFSLTASLVVRFLGPKNAVVLGTTGYWLFIAANLYPSWYIMVPASFYLGFSASIIWVGQGTYLTLTARSHAKDHYSHEGTVIGHFNGEFWSMFASHQFVGNLISLAILRDGKEGSTSGTTLLFIVFLGIATLGIMLMCFLSKIDTNGEEEEESSSDYNRHLYGLHSPRIFTPALGVSGVGGAMAVYGAFDAIIVSGGALLHAIVFIWILLNSSMSPGIFRAMCPLLMAAMLGIGDGVCNTQLNALLGILLKNDMEGAFAQLKVWQSASIAVVFFVYAYISLQAMVLTMIAALCVSVAAFLFPSLHVERAFASPNF